MHQIYQSKCKATAISPELYFEVCWYFNIHIYSWIFMHKYGNGQNLSCWIISFSVSQVKKSHTKCIWKYRCVYEIKTTSRIKELFVQHLILSITSVYNFVKSYLTCFLSFITNKETLFQQNENVSRSPENCANKNPLLRFQCEPESWNLKCTPSLFWWGTEYL